MNVFDILREKLEELPIDTKIKSNTCSCGWVRDIYIPIVEKDAVKEIINQVEQQYNDGWIPVSERYPENDDCILLSFENFPVPAVGRYEEDEEGGAFFAGDDDVSLVSRGAIVNAWRPLPAPYKEDMHPVKQTNADRIRSMTDEELAVGWPCPYDTQVMGLCRLRRSKGEKFNIYSCIGNIEAYL